MAIWVGVTDNSKISSIELNRAEIPMAMAL